MSARNMGQLVCTLLLVGAGALGVVSCGSSKDTPGADRGDAAVDGPESPTDGAGMFSDATLGPACTPKMCQDLGFTCGQNGNGCGAVLDCGASVSPPSCCGAGYRQCSDGHVGCAMP